MVLVCGAMRVLAPVGDRWPSRRSSDRSGSGGMQGSAAPATGPCRRSVSRSARC